MIVYKFTALVTVIAVIYTFVLGGKVGSLRGKKNVPAPATTGDPEFERAFRIQGNTNEQFILFLPLLWLATSVVGDMWAAAAGAVWVLGRIIYANSYMADPSKRTTGMLITIAATAALAIITLYGIVMAFL